MQALTVAGRTFCVTPRHDLPCSVDPRQQVCSRHATIMSVVADGSIPLSTLIFTLLLSRVLPQIRVLPLQLHPTQTIFLFSTNKLINPLNTWIYFFLIGIITTVFTPIPDHRRLIEWP